MARLPQPGGDRGNWGQILNQYLSVSHNSDGTLKNNGALAAKYTKPASGIPMADLSAAVQSAISNATGDDGRDVQLQANTTHIQWRYVGDASWINLVALADITGPAGADGAQGEQGPQGVQGPQGPAGANSTVVGPEGPQGPEGPAGPAGQDGTGITILGSYATEGELNLAHPSGNLGDAYLVGGDLYVWNGSSWGNVGQIRGPEGPAGSPGDDGADGIQGPPGQDGAKGDDGAQGPAGPGVPTGGGSGQVLAKASSGDYDTEWVDQASGGGGSGPVTYSTLPAGSTISVYFSGGSWPARPTARTDITVQWIGGEVINAPTAGVPGVDLWVAAEKDM